MAITSDANNLHQVSDLSLRQGDTKCFDDDGRPKRTGTVWTASAHIITAVIGSGVLYLPWATAQLGWIAGPAFLLMFSLITYYTSTLLAECYRNSVTGTRNNTYMDVVGSKFDGLQLIICGFFLYLNLFEVAIVYTVASSISMMDIERSYCFHTKGDQNPRHTNKNPYMIAFGVVQVIFSQIPEFHKLWWLSTVAAVMSFTYSTIGLGLGIAKIAETGKFRGSLTGISIGTVTETQKIWRSFQALGDVAFAFSFSIILIEIQDTLKSPPTESETMKKASLISIGVTTLFYMLCACLVYAAFGDLSPGNFFSGFGYNPYMLLDIANAAIVIHLVGAYQVYSQPIFSFVEKQAVQRFPDCEFITKDIKVPIPGFNKPYNLNPFRLVWRTIFVILTTVIPMLLPIFNADGGLIGALGFWPRTVYYPVEIYIAEKKIPKWSTKWLCLQILSMACLVISIAAAAGSIAGVVTDIKSHKPFSTGNKFN